MVELTEVAGSSYGASLVISTHVFEPLATTDGRDLNKLEWFRW